MKLLRSEFGHEYQKYRFGYCQHAQREPGDELAALYEGGFLPYSGDPAVKDLFYMARSARIALPEFSFTSENRRIAKRFDGAFSYRLVPLAERAAVSEIRALFLEYFEKRHGKEVMPPVRLDAILEADLPLVFHAYYDGPRLKAAALEVRDSAFGHFWFSAYDLALARQSLGMWLMLDAARRAKEAGLTYYYLGTVYGTKALYKTNLEPLAFWDGSAWDADTARLRGIARTES